IHLLRQHLVLPRIRQLIAFLNRMDFPSPPFPIPPMRHLLNDLFVPIWISWLPDNGLQKAHTSFAIHSDTIIIIQAQSFSSRRKNKSIIHKAKFLWLFAFVISEIFVHLYGIAKWLIVKISKWYERFTCIQCSNS
ncbi:hypothetical protein ALC56_14618, partial [Trachymyrmex septentrionalis]